ncbi:uncharacterized protein B0T23DRAFT_98550 [Neurospora hispaniola]|uniref:Uncharacterized protein n=1 Tax=Neurospora hispaniola TaxID=588809 RepID=A0AAJ0IDZ2_9PEZI|nr:hypothetical protein B0T23DRAFT_98550 [Neurospora hispaniola]
MDHNNYHQSFNHLPHPLYFISASPVHASPLGSPPEPRDYHYAPASPSDFIYNSSAIANSTANGTASTSTGTSIFDRPSRPSSSSSSSSRSLFSISNERVFGYPPAGVEYSGPSTGAVERSVLDYLEVPGVPTSSLPQPTPGFEEHRRQRQSTTMNMGPGPSKSVPPALSLGRERGSNASSSEETVVIKREEGSLSPVWVSIPLGQRVERWVPRVTQGKEGKQIKQVEGDGGMDNGISGGRTWGKRGEGVVMERVVMPPPTVQSMGGDVGSMEMGMGMEPTIMPKMGLFKPIRWDGPSSSSSASKTKARRVRAWETLEGDCGNDHFRRTCGNQDGNGNGNENGNRNRNDETEDEKVSDAPISPHSRSPKRLKTSSRSRYTFCPGPAETETKTDTEIKQEPGLSPPPSAIFAQIPRNPFDAVPSNSGYESSGQYDDSLSPRSISPLTRVPTPRRVLFTTTPNRIMTGTRETTQPSLRAVSKQLKKRNREMALGQQGREDNREVSRERSDEASREPRKKRRGEGGWSLPGGSQGQTHGASLQQQQQHRGSSEEREKGWTTTISGSSEEGEVSSYYENSYSYSCGQQERRDRDDAAAAAASSNNALSCTDQEEEEEWCRPFSFSSSAPVSFETSARYGDYVSAPPSLSVSQLKGEEYRQAIIQMVQDTCLEASKRYIRAHCVNRGARDGGGSPDTSPAPRQTVSTRSARKARRKHKLESRQAFSSSFSSSSSSPESSPAPAPSQQRRKGKGKSKRQNRTKKRTTATTTPPSSSSSSFNSPHHQPPPEIHLRDALLPNISQICTLLWSRSQSLRLHDTDSIELHTARNMYWLLSWAETVAFAVAVAAPAAISDAGMSPCTSVDSLSSSSSSSVAAASVPGGPCLEEEDLGVQGEWYRSSSFSLRRRKREWEWDWEWEGFGEGVSEEGDKAKGGFESRNGKAVWEQQRIEEMMKRVFDEGGMLCEFLGYGEGVERLGRVREFCGF